MIIKVKTSKTPRFKQLLDYLTKSPDKVINDRGEVFMVQQHLFGLTNETMAEEFLFNEQNRIHHRANNTKLNHEIIAFSDLDKDKITIPILKDLTQEYLSQRSPYMQAFAIAHFDTDHQHVHIVSSPIELISQKNLRMSKTDFAELKLHMQEYQMEKYPELSNSIVEHGRKEKDIKLNIPIETTIDKEFRVIERLGKETNKTKIRTAIENSFSVSNSKEQFLEQLSLQGFQTYTRGGDTKGISYGNKNYRFNTIINDYNERLNHLELKMEREDELRDLRESKQDRDYDLEKEESEYSLASEVDTDDAIDDEAIDTDSSDENYTT